MTKPFRVVLADPPWTFKDTGSRINPAYGGKARKSGPKYEILANRDIQDVIFKYDINEMIADDAFLFMWAPNSLVLDFTAQETILAWGFRPKQQITWVKRSISGGIRFGGGNYTRACTEQLILATRGKPKVQNRGVAGLIEAPRGEHSAKPDDSYKLIERLCAGPYLELFARRRWSYAWMTWGIQAPDGIWR